MSFLDGPRAGEWVTASVVVPSNRTFKVSTGSAKEGLVDIHEYELGRSRDGQIHPALATRPLVHGPIAFATPPRSSARQAS